MDILIAILGSVFILSLLSSMICIGTFVHKEDYYPDTYWLWWGLFSLVIGGFSAVFSLAIQLCQLPLPQGKGLVAE